MYLRVFRFSQYTKSQWSYDFEIWDKGAVIIDPLGGGRGFFWGGGGVSWFHV